MHRLRAQLVIFKSGTKREEICDFIGAGRNPCGRIIRHIVVPEDCVTLAFALGNGHFDFTPPPAGQPRAASAFCVRRETSDRIWLEPK